MAVFPALLLTYASFGDLFLHFHVDGNKGNEAGVRVFELAVEKCH